jgi:uncharacterized protein (DUF952 family)
LLFSVVIYHVTTEKEWASYGKAEEYAPEAYEREAFVHTCHLHQLKGVLERYFKGQPDLLLLHIAEEKLTSACKHEAAVGGELFPHIYGRINKTAIVKITRGTASFPNID